MSNASPNPRTEPWPDLPTAAWRETYETLHLWTQIIGKIRLARAPWLNHSWHVALYVTARGLTTSPIPDGARSFQIDLDLIDHAVRISTSDGATRQFRLAGHSVASFYAAIMAALAELGRQAAQARPHQEGGGQEHDDRDGGPLAFAGLGDEQVGWPKHHGGRDQHEELRVDERKVRDQGPPQSGGERHHFSPSTWAGSASAGAAMAAIPVRAAACWAAVRESSL